MLLVRITIPGWLAPLAAMLGIGLLLAVIALIAGYHPGSKASGEKAAPTPKVCPMCGAPIPSDVKRCAECADALAFVMAGPYGP